MGRFYIRSPPDAICLQAGGLVYFGYTDAPSHAPGPGESMLTPVSPLILAAAGLLTAAATAGETIPISSGRRISEHYPYAASPSRDAR